MIYMAEPNEALLPFASFISEMGSLVGRSSDLFHFKESFLVTVGCGNPQLQKLLAFFLTFHRFNWKLSNSTMLLNKCVTGSSTGNRSVPLPRTRMQNCTLHYCCHRMGVPPCIHSLPHILAAHGWHGVLTAHVRPIAFSMAAYHWSVCATGAPGAASSPAHRLPQTW